MTPLLAFAAAFVFSELPQGQLKLSEGEAPILVYNYGVQLPAGVPTDRARCCYVHPLWTPSGVVVSDDFPKDHFHHRGLFWSWPIVIAGSQRGDLWALKGMERRHEKHAHTVTGDRAVLRAESGWWMGERKVAAERVVLTVYPAAKGERKIDIEIRLAATGGAVSIAGAPEQSKGYGGLSVRFAPREGTLIRSSEGAVEKDEDHGRHAWAELSALYGGKPATVRIASDPLNPGFPSTWCLRHYGFAGANFPGVEAHRIEPGEPLVLRYTVTVSDRR